MYQTEAGIKDNIDPGNRHGFELGLPDVMKNVFGVPLEGTSIIFAAGVSYLDSSGASNIHPDISEDRVYYNTWWAHQGASVVTGLYSTPTPNLPHHYAFLDALINFIQRL